MARSRNIKPGFFKNCKLADCGKTARLLFAGLWCHADREGRLEDSPRELKAEIFPFDDDVTPNNVNDDLDKLADAKFIMRYSHLEEKYLQIINFNRHQNPHVKEQASTIPAPDLSGDCTGNSGTSRADSLLPITDSLNPITDSLIPRAKPSRAAKEVITAETWVSYCSAYRSRYGVDPVRNAKGNAMLMNLVKRIGESEAPAVAAFYVRHNRALYVSAKHAIDLLLRDCEGLRTEWATGHTVTDTEARQADRKANNLGIAERLIAENRAKREANGK